MAQLLLWLCDRKWKLFERIGIADCRGRDDLESQQMLRAELNEEGKHLLPCKRTRMASTRSGSYSGVKPSCLATSALHPLFPFLSQSGFQGPFTQRSANASDDYATILRQNCQGSAINPLRFPHGRGEMPII